MADLRRALRRGERLVSPPLVRRATRQAEVLGLPLAEEQPEWVADTVAVALGHGA